MDPTKRMFKYTYSTLNFFSILTIITVRIRH